MTNLSLKERILVSVLGVIALYAFAAGFWFLHARQAWTGAERRYKSARATYEREAKLIGERGKWDALYEEEAANIPVIEGLQGSDTVWLPRMDAIAASNHVYLSSSKLQKEEETGEMMQIKIESRWEAGLEPLVKFLHELENTAQGSFDVENLSFAPSRKPGYLTGTFTLVCIYYRKSGE